MLNTALLIAHLKQYRNFYTTGLLIVLLVVFIIVVFKQCGDYMFERELENKKRDVNILLDNANEKKEILDNLNREAYELELNVNAKGAELNKAKGETENAQNKTNKSLENVKKIENGNYSNSSVDSANRARCKAFPNAVGCK
jgi:hypothetical protein